MKARAPKPPRKMETEERTLEKLDHLAPIPRFIAVHAYLIAAYWSWWMVLFVPSFILWRVFPSVRILPWVTGAMVVLALGGLWGKGFIEENAPRWV